MCFLKEIVFREGVGKHADVGGSGRRLAVISSGERRWATAVSVCSCVINVKMNLMIGWWCLKRWRGGVLFYFIFIK